MQEGAERECAETRVGDDVSCVKVVRPSRSHSLDRKHSDRILAMSKQKPDQDGARVDLPLVRGAPDQRVSLILFLQTIVFGLSHLCTCLGCLHVARKNQGGCRSDPSPSPTVFVLPLKLFFEYIVFRPINPLVKDIGRPLLAHAIVRQIATCYDRWTPAQIRLLLDRKNSYTLKHSGSEFKGWVTRVEVNGTAGRWLAPPGSQRKDDDVVIYFVHGGGFMQVTPLTSGKKPDPCLRGFLSP